MSNISSRLDRIEIRITRHRCMTCFGAAYAVVFVPEGENEDAPEWNPTHCRECGVSLRSVRQIVGISEREMFSESVERAG